MTTYPLTMPAGDVIAHRVRHVDNVATARSVFTGEEQKQRWQGERFEYDVSLSPMERLAAMAWAAFFRLLAGPYGTFLFGDPDFLAAGPLGSLGGTPLVDGASQPIASETLATKGWTALQPNALRAGDFFQLGSGSSARLHMNLRDVTPDSAGRATLDIWPRLRTSPADNAALTIAGALGVFELAEPVTEYDSNALMIHGISFRVREAL